MEIAAIISFLALVVMMMGLPAGQKMTAAKPALTTRTAAAKA